MNVYTYVGKYGPGIQYGGKDDNPRYVSISKVMNLMMLIKYLLKKQLNY